MRNGYAGGVGRVLAVAITLSAIGGCATRAQRLEVHWYTPMPDAVSSEASEQPDSWVEMKGSYLHLPPLSSPTAGARDGDYTVFALPPGNYEFEYMLPGSDDLLYGEIDVHGSCNGTVREFIRRTFVTISTGAPGGDPGFTSVLTEEDLDRVRHGDMVTKLVFVADLRAIDRRLDMIERELRRIRDLETRLTGQLDYWKVKLAERRRNAFYNSEYGVDIPAGGLALLQSAVGAETYHWVRYTEAEDKVRSYEEEIAKLALPAERLREERAALRGMLASAKVVYRRKEMMLATFRMQRQFFDITEEVTSGRDTLHGPKNTLEDPYLLSSVTKSLGYPRLLPNKTRMPKKKQDVGEVVMVMRLGLREACGR